MRVSKKFGLLIACAAFAAGAAGAQTYTIEFAQDGGETQTWTFDGATSTATNDAGVSTPYTYDEAAKEICADVPEQGELCVTFAETGQDVGGTTTYTVSTGATGTATLVAVSE